MFIPSLHLPVSREPCAASHIPCSKTALDWEKEEVLELIRKFPIKVKVQLCGK
jgi:hypothetical protein